MQLKKVQYTAKAHSSGGFGLLSRLCVVLCSATMSIGTSAAVLAQQPAGQSGHIRN